MPIAFVQGAIQSYPSSTAARTCAYPANVTAGNLLVVVVSAFNAVTVTLADTLGQTYSQAVRLVAGTITTAIYYVENSTGGANTVTVTPSATAYVSIAVHEYSGAATSGSLDASASASALSTNPSPGAVAAAAGELIVAAYGQGSNTLASSTVASPFAVREANLNGSSNEGLQTADDVNASGTETPTFATNLNVFWVAVAASFRPTGAAAPTWTPFIRPATPPDSPPLALAPRLLLSAALLTGGVAPSGTNWIPFARPPRPPEPAAAATQRSPLLPAALLPGTSPSGPGKGKNKPYLPRVPKPPQGNSPTELADYARRLARHTEVISDAFNSWVDAGHVVQFASRKWAIRTGAVVMARDPNANDDANSGYPTGCLWINTATQQGFMCIANAAGAALWRQTT